MLGGIARESQQPLDTQTQRVPHLFNFERKKWLTLILTHRKSHHKPRLAPCLLAPIWRTSLNLMSSP